MRRNGGFTLFELLLAIGIVIMLTATMAGSLAISFKLKKAAEYSIDSIRDIQTVGDIVAHDLMSAVPPNPNSAIDPNAIGGSTSMTNSTTGATTGSVSMGGVNFIYGEFYGDSQTLYFYCTGAEKGALTQCGIEYVEFSLAPQTDGTQALIRQAETNLLSDTDPTTFPSAIPPEVLVTNVVSLTLQYYDGTSWYDTWDSTQNSNTLPYSVEIQLKIKGAHDGDPDRVITRYASVSCAAPPVDTSGTTSTGGIVGFGN